MDALLGGLGVRAAGCGGRRRAASTPWRAVGGARRRRRRGLVARRGRSSSPPSLPGQERRCRDHEEHGNDDGQRSAGCARRVRPRAARRCLLALVVLPRQLSLPLRAARHRSSFLRRPAAARGRPGQVPAVVRSGQSRRAGISFAGRWCPPVVSAARPALVLERLVARAHHRIPGRRVRHQLLRPRARARRRSASSSTRASGSSTSSTTCSPSTGCSRSPCCSRTGTSTTRSRSRRSAAPATSRPTSTRTTTPMLADPLGLALAGDRGPVRRPPRLDRARRRAPLTDGEVLRIAGLELTVDHAPGHTRGSVAFRLPDDDDRARGDALRRPAVRRLASAAPTCPAATTPRCCAASPPRS